MFFVVFSALAINHASKHSQNSRGRAGIYRKIHSIGIPGKALPYGLGARICAGVLRKTNRTLHLAG